MGADTASIGTREVPLTNTNTVTTSRQQKSERKIENIKNR